jgi:hypothetical protein
MPSEIRNLEQIVHNLDCLAHEIGVLNLEHGLYQETDLRKFQSSLLNLATKLDKIHNHIPLTTKE